MAGETLLELIKEYRPLVQETALLSHKVGAGGDAMAEGIGKRKTNTRGLSFMQLRYLALTNPAQKKNKTNLKSLKARNNLKAKELLTNIAALSGLEPEVQEVLNAIVGWSPPMPGTWDLTTALETVQKEYETQTLAGRVTAARQKLNTAKGKLQAAQSSTVSGTQPSDKMQRLETEVLTCKANLAAERNPNDKAREEAALAEKRLVTCATLQSLLQEPAQQLIGAKENLKNAKADLKKATENSQNAKADLKTATENLQNAKADLKMAGQELTEAQQSLQAQENFQKAQKELEAEKRLKTSKGQLETARTGVKNAENNLTEEVRNKSPNDREWLEKWGKMMGEKAWAQVRAFPVSLRDSP